MAEHEFFNRLLGDWATRTENPWEANLFYIPTFTYYYIGRCADRHHTGMRARGYALVMQTTVL